MVPDGGARREITAKDLQRVRAARRALRAYEPYGPVATRRTAPGAGRMIDRARAAGALRRTTTVG